MLFKDFPVAPSIESFPITIRAQLLKDLFIRFFSILEIHSTGYLLILYDGVDEIYIKIKNIIEEILNSEGFSGLLEKFPQSIPTSLHSLGSDADIEWEFLNQEIVVFQGSIIEFCVNNHASYEEVKDIFCGVLKSYDDFIDGYKRKKMQDCQDWLRNIEKKAKSQNPLERTNKEFINSQRILNLREIQSDKFDLSKLIRLCDEINKCFFNECYFAVALLSRSLIDHISPIFNLRNFHEVANNYNEGGKSFKETMQHLDFSLRKIADLHLHNQIRSKEVLPNNTQIDFSNEIDLLLAEICRLLKN